MGIDKPNIRYVIHDQAPGSLVQHVQKIGRAGRDDRPANCVFLFDAADLDVQERLQALGRPAVWHLARLKSALTAWATEQRAPTAATLAYSAGVPVRIGEVLLSDLEQAGLIQRDQESRISLAVPLETVQAGACDLVAKLKTFRYEGERRLKPSPTTPVRGMLKRVPPAVLRRGTRRVAGAATVAAASVPRLRAPARHGRTVLEK